MPPLAVSLPEGIIRKSTLPTPRPSSPYVTCIGVSEYMPRLTGLPLLPSIGGMAMRTSRARISALPGSHFAATFEVMLPVLSTSATSGPAMGPLAATFAPKCIPAASAFSRLTLASMAGLAKTSARPSLAPSPRRETRFFLPEAMTKRGTSMLAFTFWPALSEARSTSILASPERLLPGKSAESASQSATLSVIEPSRAGFCPEFSLAEISPLPRTPAASKSSWRKPAIKSDSPPGRGL